MSETNKYLTQVDAIENGQSVTLLIRDAEVWNYITEFGGTLEVIILNALPDPNGTIPSGEYAGEKWGAYYYGKIVLTNEANIGTDNTYDEYIIRRDGTPGSYTYAWEKIGTTDLNMAAYSTKGHVHAVDTNVSVDDHEYTPEGTLVIELINYVNEYTPTVEEDYLVSNAWQNDDESAHVLLDVETLRGKHITCVKGLNTQYAFLTASGASTVTFVTGTSLVNAQMRNVLVPDTAKYLYFFCGNDFPENAVQPIFIIEEWSQHVSGHVTPSGSIALVTAQQGDAGAIPVMSGLTGSTADAGAHKHDLGDRHFVKKKTHNVVDNVQIANDTAATPQMKVPTVNKTNNAADISITQPKSAFVKKYTRQVNGSAVDSAPIVQAVATQIRDTDNYSLSFLAGTPVTEEAVTSVSHSWGSNNSDKPLKSSAFGEKGIKANVTKKDLENLLEYNYKIPFEYTVLGWLSLITPSQGQDQYIQLHGSYYPITVEFNAQGTGSPLTVDESLTLAVDNSAMNPMHYEFDQDECSYGKTNATPTVVDLTSYNPQYLLLNNTASQMLIGKISIYNKTNGNLIRLYIPVQKTVGSVTKKGLYDVIGDAGFVEIAAGASSAESESSTGMPFVGSSSGETAESGTHNHGLGTIEGTNSYIKATFTGESCDLEDGHTAKTLVDETNTEFQGTPETLQHTVHNPRVYTGPDDYDDYFRFNDWYGVQYDENVADTAKTRIGNMTMHKTLPIQSRMRRCLLNDDGTVNYYLDANDSRLKAGGTAANLTGTDGQVMVEIPKHWRKVTKDANDVVTAMISPYKQEGWMEVPKCYVSAYEARIVSNKLCSVSNIVNLSIALQDGIPVVTCDLATAANQAAITSALPTTNVTMDALRSAARARHSVDGDPDTRWNMLVYESYLAVYWLYVIEYANTNSQAAFNSALTADGYHQGGLGAGCTTLTSANWNTFSGGGTSNYKPFIPCGVTNVLGNNSGEVKVVIPTSLDSSGVIKVCSYRGIENPFGHIWKFADGIKYLGNGSNQNVLRCDTPSNYSSASNSTNYTSIGTNVAGSGVYKKKIMVGDDGDINCAATGGSDATYYCDYNYEAHDNGKYYCCLLGGSATYGAYAGLASVSSTNAVAYSYTAVGSRLCFFEK